MRSLRLSQQQVKSIMDDVLAAYPHEACGMIAGQDIDAIQILRIDNVADQPQSHYVMDGMMQLQALKTFEHQGLDWLAVYHSHPEGKPQPSQEDIRAAVLHTPNLIHVIVGLKNHQTQLQAWHIHDGQVDEVELLIGSQASMAVPSVSRLETWSVIFAILLGIIILVVISFLLLPPAPSLPLPQ